MGLISTFADIGVGTIDLIKANSYARGIISPPTKAQGWKGPGEAFILDPDLMTFTAAHYREKPYTIHYALLRHVYRRDGIISAIVLNRLGQVSAFSSIRTSDEVQQTIGTGFRVMLKSGAAKKRTKAVTDREDYFNNFIVHCSRDDVPKHKRVEKTFSRFLRRFCEDSLVLDQPCAEIELDAKGSPVQFFAVDGATIRITEPGSPLFAEIPYVQVHNGRPIAAFTEDQLIFGAQNVTSEMSRYGYGYSPIEFGIKMVMAHLGIDTSNERMFHPQATPKGLLVTENFEVSEEQMQAMEIHWRNQMTDAKAKHRMPILGVPRGGKINMINFPVANEIEFAKFLDYLTNLLCSLYGMDPLEINFPNRGGPGQSGAVLGGQGNWLERLTASKDRGLKWLLAFIANIINLELMPLLDLDDEFEFRFIGLDAKSDKERASLAKDQSSVFKTVNEIRSEYGMPRDKDGDIILNSVYMQAQQSRKQQESQQQGVDTGSDSDQNMVDGAQNGDAPGGGQPWMDYLTASQGSSGATGESSGEGVGW